MSRPTSKHHAQASRPTGGGSRPAGRQASGHRAERGPGAEPGRRTQRAAREDQRPDSRHRKPRAGQLERARRRELEEVTGNRRETAAERPAGPAVRSTGQKRPARAEDRSGRPGSRADRGARPARRSDRGGRPERGYDKAARAERRYDERDRPRTWQRKPVRTSSAGTDHFERVDRGERVDHSQRVETSTPIETSTPLEELTSSGTFTELGVHPGLVAALAAGGITSPFPIQQATIPDALNGLDLLGRGQTGSGKTLAFSLPVLTRLLAGEHGPGPRAVILSPTRELAAQIAEVIAPLARATGLSSVLIAGGMAYPPQKRALRTGVQVVIATPGRLIDLMDQGEADLSRVGVVVLDEADQMSDMGFLPEVSRILDAIPAKAQKLLFSATLDEQVDKLVTTYLRHPVVHGVGLAGASVTTMRHLVLVTEAREWEPVISQVVDREGRTMVFVRTQRRADELALGLRGRGVLAGALHGGMTQAARTRVMRIFREGTLPVLVATDVAARGIDVEEVSLVVQADLPHDAKDYTHRAGRTARAGGRGTVVTIARPGERSRVTRLTRQVGVNAPMIKVSEGDEAISEVSGEAVAGGKAPIDESAYAAMIAPRSAGPGGRAPKRRFHSSHRTEGRPGGGQRTRPRGRRADA